ncbi:PREDICTED: immunoglobulin-binding protein 1 [Pygoscelis adeliae]|uniref:immunoglobulin-binding protein 1 n=1 Tax=Pygoscelis adeliae TaxID=9238 RepID=UPI0004F4F369|nr:PREDICTED: immunoglobulin-binding protein 1 [Pygoscelis adeliae]
MAPPLPLAWKLWDKRFLVMQPLERKDESKYTGAEENPQHKEDSEKQPRVKGGLRQAWELEVEMLRGEAYAHIVNQEDAGSPTPGGPAAAQPSLVAMASSRQAKIERYKQKKELENRLASMRTFVESGQADEDQIREFYILQIQKWINTSLEEIESIDQEVVILRSRGTAKQSSAPPHGTSRQVRAPLKPFILTRDAAQAKVFGAGYPGLPTMTVDDWYEQRRRQGVVSGQSAPQGAPGITDEELQKQQQEKKEEEDDEEALQKARNWDDWKDTHPRGYGNRQNVG